jgi:hypothetical protein
MSHSNTHSYLLVLKMWISEIASCARRLGRKPYEDGLKVAIQLVRLDGVTQPVGWGELIVGVSG